MGQNEVNYTLLAWEPWYLRGLNILDCQHRVVATLGVLDPAMFGYDGWTPEAVEFVQDRFGRRIIEAVNQTRADMAEDPLGFCNVVCALPNDGITVYNRRTGKMYAAMLQEEFRKRDVKIVDLQRKVRTAERQLKQVQEASQNTEHLCVARGKALEDIADALGHFWTGHGHAADVRQLKAKADEMAGQLSGMVSEEIQQQANVQNVPLKERLGEPYSKRATLDEALYLMRRDAKVGAAITQGVPDHTVVNSLKLLARTLPKHSPPRRWVGGIVGMLESLARGEEADPLEGSTMRVEAEGGQVSVFLNDSEILRLDLSEYLTEPDDKRLTGLAFQLYDTRFNSTGRNVTSVGIERDRTGQRTGVRVWLGNEHHRLSTTYLLDRAKEYGVLGVEEVRGQYMDDRAVDAFAAAMKEKLAAKRAEGYSGWEDKAQCSTTNLQFRLHQHVLKGDPVDVGNLAMMLWCRDESTTRKE